MNLKIKLLIAMSAGLLSLVISAPFVFQSGDFESAKTETVEHANQLRRSVRAYVELQNELLADRLAKQIEVSHANSSFENGEFVGVALIEDSQVKWFQSQQASLDVEWFRTEMATHLKGIDRSSNKDEVTWLRLQSPLQQVYFAMLTRLNVKSHNGEKLFLAVGLLPSSIFSPVSVVAKGARAQLFLIDNFGFALSYPDQKYVGSKTSSNPFVAAAINQKPIEAYTSREGVQRVGGVERVSNSNLMIVADAPILLPGPSRMQMVIQFLLISLVVVVMTAWAFGYLTDEEIRQKQILVDNFKMLSEKGSSETVVIDESEIRLKEFARGVVKCLQSPLTSIAGLIHLAQAKNTDKAVREVLEKITFESRRSRDFIESMSKVLPASDYAQNVIDIVPLLDQLAGVASHESRKANVQFENDVIGEYQVRCNGNEIKDALKTMMMFALQVMGAESKEAFEKTLRLRIRRIGGQVEITFDVIGAHLKKEIRRKAFQPFQSHFAKSRMLGLDMAIASTVIEEHNGTVGIDASSEAGFQIHVRLPISISLETKNTIETLDFAGKQETRAEVQPTKNAEVEAAGHAHAEVDAFVQKIETQSKSSGQDDVTLVLNQEIPLVSRVESKAANNESFFVKIRKPKVRLDI
jgi:signal transduction histidine kinase